MSCKRRERRVDRTNVKHGAGYSFEFFTNVVLQ